MRRRASRRAGYTAIELLVVGGLALVLLTIGVASLLELSSAYRMELAAHELVSLLRRTRSLALTEGARVGVKFFPTDERVGYAIYRDGDGDGVRTKDIESGVDPAATPPLTLHRLGGDVRFGFPPGKPPRDPGDPRRRLTRLRDPIRFNRSDIASFGPLGESTPGSLYLTDGEALAVVRLFGRTGKVKILFYDREKEVWK